MPFDGPASVLRKTGYRRAESAPAAAGRYDFILSTPTRDSYGDVVKAPWNLTRFKANPIALWMHDAERPIGRWENVRMDGDNLVGTLVLAARGTCDEIDELWSLIEQGILKAVSVGFRPGKAEPIDPKNPWDGYVLSDNELIECSLVSIPANAEALLRSLSHSPAHVRRYFAPESGQCVGGSACAVLQASKTRVSEKPTVRSTSTSIGTRMTLSDKIKAKQADLNSLQDQIEQITDSIDGAGALSEVQQLQLDELALRVEKATGDLETLTRTEAALAKKAGSPAAPKDERKAPSIQLIESKPKGQRALQTIAAIVKAQGLRSDPVQVARDYYRDQSDIEMLVRAATGPADTSDSTWASKLIQETWSGFVELLRDSAVQPRVPGLRVNFSNTLNIPVQNGRGALAAGFIAENGAIPVKEGSIGTTSLAPKKLAVISAYTKELARRSMPSIEAIVRQQILDDTAEALDTAFLSSTARSSTAPAGLRDTTETGSDNINAVTNVATGAHGCTVAEIITDTSAVLTRVWAIRAKSGVWIMNPAQRLALEDKQEASTGFFVFRDEVSQGRFRGYPIIESTNVTAGIVAFVADNAMGFGSELMPAFEMSDSATLHFEGASPSAISAAATPNTVAAPVISLFQQDLFAIKMVMSLDWRILRQAGVQVLTAATGW